MSSYELKKRNQIDKRKKEVRNWTQSKASSELTPNLECINYRISTLQYPKQVRVEGLEPPCLTAPDPKSGTSTNFATPACNYLIVKFLALFFRKNTTFHNLTDKELFVLRRQRYTHFWWKKTFVFLFLKDLSDFYVIEWNKVCGQNKFAKYWGVCFFINNWFSIFYNF